MGLLVGGLSVCPAQGPCQPASPHAGWLPGPGAEVWGREFPYSRFAFCKSILKPLLFSVLLTNLYSSRDPSEVAPDVSAQSSYCILYLRGRCPFHLSFFPFPFLIHSQVELLLCAL